MRFGNWLMSLDWLHHLILLVYLAIGLALTHWIIVSVEAKMRSKNRFAEDIHAGPIVHFIFAFGFMALAYTLTGPLLHDVLITLF